MVSETINVGQPSQKYNYHLVCVSWRRMAYKKISNPKQLFCSSELHGQESWRTRFIAWHGKVSPAMCLVVL